MTARLFAVYVPLAAAALVAQGQTGSTPPQSTFRGGVHFVRVDMYASRDGVPLLDLRPNEIEVLEDGATQTIVAFERVDVPIGGPEATRVEPNSIRAGQQAAADPRARVFVLFLDGYHMDAQTAVQADGPIRRFLDEALGPDDLVALMMPEMPLSSLTFTRRASGLAGILGRTSEWMLRERDPATDPLSSPDPIERLYAECYPPPTAPGVAARMIARRREKLALDALHDLSAHLGSIRDERKTVLVVTLGWSMFEPDQSLATRGPNEGRPPVAPIGDLLRGGRGRDGTDRITNNPTAASPAAAETACEADRIALASLDHRERMRDITGEANRANVSFYPMTPLRNPAFSQSGSLTQLSHLRQMAEDTDGLAMVNTNNFAEPMERLISDMSSYYLLGYESTNARLDGRFRTIKVSVKRAGVQVRARKGYRAALAADVAAAPARVASSTPRPDATIAQAFDAMAGPITPVPLRLKASAWTRAAAPDAQGVLWVVGELDAATRREPGWSSGATAEISVLGSTGSTSLRRSATLGPGVSSFSVRFPDAGALGPDQYAVRVSLRPSGAGSPVTDSTDVTVEAAPASLGEPVLFRRSPGTGTRYVEAADPRFARNERLRLELPTASAATAAARIVDRAGQTTQVPAQVSTRADQSGEFQWVVVDVALAPFAPGDYAVVVTLEETTRVAGFRVTR